MAETPDQSDSLLQLDMSDGRTIWCWQYLATYTFANFPIREQSAVSRDYLLKHIEHEAETLFGKCALHVVMPDGDGSSDEFPPFRFLGQFTSSPVRGKDLSALVVAWFQAAPFPVMDEANRDYVKMLDWNALSEDVEC